MRWESVPQDLQSPLMCWYSYQRPDPLIIMWSRSSKTCFPYSSQFLILASFIICLSILFAKPCCTSNVVGVLYAVKEKQCAPTVKMSLIWWLWLMMKKQTRTNHQGMPYHSFGIIWYAAPRWCSQKIFWNELWKCFGFSLLLYQLSLQFLWFLCYFFFQQVPSFLVLHSSFKVSHPCLQFILWEATING